MTNKENTYPTKAFVETTVAHDNAVSILANKNITLTSQIGAGSPFAITMLGNARHLIVAGELTLIDVILKGDSITDGAIINGGIDVNGKLMMDGNAAIQNCYNGIAHGGGIFVAALGTVEISGNTQIKNNTTSGDGGAIFTTNFSYKNPADEPSYTNISIALIGTTFSGNIAGTAFAPPSNASYFTNRPTIPFNGNLLNNNDINYRCDTTSVSITGDDIICASSTTTLSPTVGGIWVSNNPTIAEVSNSGVVTALKAGTVTFTFINDNGCSAVTLPITIKPKITPKTRIKVR